MWCTIYFRKSKFWRIPITALSTNNRIVYSQIPFYHAEEATKAIIPLLGSQYQQDKASSFVGGLWQAFTECQWVEPEQGNHNENGELRFQKGPSPAPEYKMRNWRTITSTGYKVWM